MLCVGLLIVALGETLSASGCAPNEPDDPGITRACIRSFAPTLDAWEVALGDVPAECRALDTKYDVQLVSADEMPCDDPLGMNEVRAECVSGAVVYINEALDDLQQLDASVHGWIHALSTCVYGDPDKDHLRHQLWAVYENENAVEFQAHFYGVETGSCL
jgi:hypothetical protein